MLPEQRHAKPLARPGLPPSRNNRLLSGRSVSVLLVSNAD
jgi:hypothetical protein